MAPKASEAEVAAARLALARTLDVDRITGEVVAAFIAGGVRPVVLKGPSVAEWLYADGAARSYVDTDLLVAPRDLPEAGRILTRLGFELRPVDADHARTWARYEDGRQVDLHARVPGLHLPPLEAWRSIARRTETMAVGGVEVEVPEVPLRALFVALHATHHGPDAPRPLVDLERAIDRTSGDTWREAAELAYELGAVAAFSTGLRFVPAGAQLAERLGLPSAELVEAFARPASPIPFLFGLERLANCRGLLGKLRLVAAELLPAPTFMRWWSPLARRGRLGLALAYPLRIAWLLWHLPRSVGAWRRSHAR